MRDRKPVRDRVAAGLLHAAIFVGTPAWRESVMVLVNAGVDKLLDDLERGVAAMRDGTVGH